jgi:hypothetical protein
VITYSYAVTNTGTTTLTDASVRDSQLGLSAIECGEIAFLQRTITLNAFRARAVMGIDVDGDDDIDVVSVSSGDDTIAWYQSDLLDDPDDVNPPPSFTERVITTSAESARAVAVADVGRSASGVDGAIDFVTGFLFEIAWHEGSVVEACFDFDATGDFEMDGAELSLLGGAFGQTCADPGDPEAEWWSRVDYTRDCLVDGDDLAILASAGVWGNVTPEFFKGEPDPDSVKTVCAFTCP